MKINIIKNKYALLLMLSFNINYTFANTTLTSHQDVIISYDYPFSTNTYESNQKEKFIVVDTNTKIDVSGYAYYEIAPLMDNNNNAYNINFNETRLVSVFDKYSSKNLTYEYHKNNTKSLNFFNDYSSIDNHTLIMDITNTYKSQIQEVAQDYLILDEDNNLQQSNQDLNNESKYNNKLLTSKIKLDIFDGNQENYLDYSAYLTAHDYYGEYIELKDANNQDILFGLFDDDSYFTFSKAGLYAVSKSTNPFWDSYSGWYYPTFYYVEEAKIDLIFEEDTYNLFTSIDDYLSYINDKLKELGDKVPSEIAVIEVLNFIDVINNQIPNINNTRISLAGNNIYISGNDYKSYQSILEACNNIYPQLNNILYAYPNIIQNPEIIQKLNLLKNGFSTTNNISNNNNIDLNNIDKYNIILPSKIEFDKEVYKNFKNINQYVSYLEYIIADVEDLSKNELTQIQEYIEYIFNNLDYYGVGSNKSSGKNIIKLNAKNLEEYINMQVELENNIINILDKYNIKLTKPFNNVLTLGIGSIDILLPIVFEINTNLISYFELDLNNNYNIDGIRIFLDEEGKSVYIKSEDLIKNLENNNNNFSFEIVYLEDSIKVDFFENQKEVDYCPAHIYIANNINNNNNNNIVVLAEIYNNYSNIWGSQFYNNNNLLEFATNYSGVYSLINNNNNNNNNIIDISDLSNDLQTKINFMVDNNFLDVDANSNFYPNEFISRYDFISCLVKMFFYQDPNAIPTFPDVPSSSEYYNLIGSAQKYNITNGYDDNTFKGDGFITKQDFVSVIGKTLFEQKGYSYPENTLSMLSIYNDVDNISSWTIDNIALALEHNIIKNEENFNPKSNITRAEATDLLYKLFIELYNNMNNNIIEKVSNSIDNANNIKNINYVFLIIFGLMGVGTVVGVFRKINNNKLK